VLRKPLGVGKGKQLRAVEIELILRRGHDERLDKMFDIRAHARAEAKQWTDIKADSHIFTNT